MILLLLILIVLFLAWNYYKKIYLFESKVPGMPFFQSLKLLTVRIGDSEPLVDYARRHPIFYKEGLFSWWAGPSFIVLATDPEACKFVLKEPRFHKRPPIILSRNSLRAEDLMRDNVTSLEGENYRRHRTVLNNGFRNEAILSYYSIICELTDKSLLKFPLNEDHDVASHFSRYTIDVLGKAIFNHDFERIEGKGDTYYNAYKNVMDMMNNPVAVLLRFSWGEKIPLPAIKEHLSSLDISGLFFEDLIEKKRTNPDNTILSKMLTETTAEGEQSLLSKKEVLADLWALIGAGHETSATALSYCLNTLRSFPDIQEKLHQEIKEKIGLENFPTVDQLNELEYLDCFIQEILRLHPPVPIFVSREATEDVPYNGKVIPKGSLVGIFFKIVHTNPNTWEDPLEFRPERWTENNKKGKQKFSYLPFSLGPRQCIGMALANLEIRVFMARFLQKYQVLAPVKSKPFPLDKMFIFFHDNYAPLRIVKRED